MYIFQFALACRLCALACICAAIATINSKISWQEMKKFTAIAQLENRMRSVGMLARKAATKKYTAKQQQMQQVGERQKVANRRK